MGDAHRFLRFSEFGGICHIFIVGSFSCYRDREGAGEPFSNQRSEEGAARLAGTRGRNYDAHREGLCAR